jgi:methionyl-tRNA formyltransferase
VRGLSPYPGAWTTLVTPDGRETVLKIYRTTKTGQKTGDSKPGTITTDRKRLLVACDDEWLQIDLLQLAGKKRMDAVSFLNGQKSTELFHVR